MAGYVLVRSNWTSVNSISLDLVCDVDIEEKHQSTTMDQQEETNDVVNPRKNTSSHENVTSVTLRTIETSEREDPVIILSVLQPDENQIVSIQILSSAKHIEFYHREYIGSCQGSRITELDSTSIYEASFEFNQPHEEITLKCLKLADTTELIIYCIQISISKIQLNSSSISMTNLSFDLNRVRSMVDESHLSSNARQFMTDLQHIQDQRRSKETPASEVNLGQLMAMMTGMKTPSANTRQISSTPLTSILSEIKSTLNEEVKSTCNQDNDKIKQELIALETRLQIYVDKQFLQLQQHIDQRFNDLEEKLTKLSQ